MLLSLDRLTRTVSSLRHQSASLSHALHDAVRNQYITSFLESRATKTHEASLANDLFRCSISDASLVGAIATIHVTHEVHVVLRQRGSVGTVRRRDSELTTLLETRGNNEHRASLIKLSLRRCTGCILILGVVASVPLASAAPLLSEHFLDAHGLVSVTHKEVLLLGVTEDHALLQCLLLA